jgi:four helix bundle protein
MNDPEVTMSRPPVHTNLIAHDKALEAAGESIALAVKVPAPLKPIADQVIRSANSVAANLAEGQGRIGRDRMHFWRIAYASAREVDSHLQLLAQAGVVDACQANKALETFDEVRAMTWRLLNPMIRSGPQHRSRSKAESES